MGYILILSMHADPAMPPGYSEWGGTHTYMKELLDSLNEKGIKSVLVTRQCMSELPLIEQYNQQCKIYRLQNGDAAPMDKTKLHEYHDANVLTVQKIIEDLGEKPLVIHSVYWNSGRIGMELSSKYQIPLVHSVISNSHGRQFRGAKEPVVKRAEYEQAIYDYSKWILCVSNDEKNDLIKFYNISPQKIIVAGQYIHTAFILPSHDNDGFPRLNSNISFEAQKSAAANYNNLPYNCANDHFWAYKAFTYFGRIDENKGVDHIISAWICLNRKYDKKCPPLWIIGGSINEINTMRYKCSKIIPELKEAEKENRIIWWGCIDSVGASTLLLKSLVLVTNSLYEPGGRVITEAMSEGVPVIAAPNGFALDFVKDWENGFLVSHGDEKELALKMEYFIRQPFLSNVLGENARQTAIKVVNDWDFINNHLYAYGIEPKNPTQMKTPFINFFAKRKINIFPYNNATLSNELLRNFVYECTGETVIEPPKSLSEECTSDIYYIKGENNNYVVKHPYTRITISSIVSPICKHNYIRSAVDSYNYEVGAYEADKSDILVGKDDFHQLILLRKMDTCSTNYNEYTDILSFLFEQQIPIANEDAKKYEQILRKNQLDTIENIDKLFCELSESLPEYYFEESGVFSPYVGWKMAYHLIDYNESAFDDNQRSIARDICEFFSKHVELPLYSHSNTFCCAVVRPFI